MFKKLSIRQRSIFLMACGQAIGFLFTPVLSRLYAPSDFGAFLIFTNIFSILNISITLRYEQAILYEKNSKSTQDIFSLSCFCSIVLLAFATPLLFLFHPFDKFSNHVGFIILLLITSAFFSASQKIFMMLLTKWRNFKSISNINFLKPGLVGFIQVMIGLLSVGFLPLAIGHTLAYLTLLSATLYFDARLIKYVARFKISPNLVETAHKFKDYPIFNMSQNVVYVISEAAIPFLIVAKYGLAAGGIYWFASKVTTVPSQVLVESVRPMVYKQVSSCMLHGNKILNTLLKNSVLLSIPFLFFSLVLYFFGSFIFNSVFGAKWDNGGILASILLISSAVNAAIVPFIATLPVIKRQHHFLIVEVVCLVVKSLSFLLFSRYLNLEQVLLTSVAFSAAIYLIFMISIIYKLKQMKYEK